ncbi:hypothetical protein PTTG_31009, partial [Puccinia triticina 1-1 BBBD Race 1]
MDLIPEDPELTGLVNLFNDQFDLFVRAREAQNWRSVRMILTQAVTTQDMIQEIAGREETIRICQEWIPRIELNELERTLYHQGNNYAPPAIAAPPFAEQSVPSYSAAPAPSAYDGDADPRASEFSTPNARGGVPGSYPSVQPRASATTAAYANPEPQPSAQRQYLGSTAAAATAASPTA